MKIFTVIVCAALLAGCRGAHPKGTARFDDYDSLKIEQMTGNNVSRAVFAKTIVCLNARRETRRVVAVTNSTTSIFTNQAVHAITNQTVSVATNLMVTSMTNLSPALPLPPPPAAVENPGGAAAETNGVAVVTNPAAALSTNATVSVANNASGSISPNQRTSNQQHIRTINNQLTTTSNNLSIAWMTNLVVTAETNLVVNYVTNTSVVSVTNVIITPTNGVAYDYFLYSELIPPPDFTLAPGESLILLVDGVRHGFSQGQSGTAFVARKGFTSSLYRVPPEVLVAIANARDVRVRFRGVNSVVERTLSRSSRQNFREFVAKYFAPPTAAGSQEKLAGIDAPADLAHR